MGSILSSGFSATAPEGTRALESDIFGPPCEGNIDLKALRRVRERPLTKLQNDAFQAIFKDVDANKDGSISKEELQAIFAEFENPLKPEEADQMMEIADQNKDGTVNLPEFKILLKKLLQLYLESHRLQNNVGMLKVAQDQQLCLAALETSGCQMGLC